jgi:hypothetical protein
MEYQQRQDNGENMDIAIRNERKNLENLEKKKERLYRDIILEKNITISVPKLIGAAVVVPLVKKENAPKGVSPMVSDEEIERIGMDAALKHEQSEGRKPEDVSEIKGLGFDIRSINKIGEVVRYIEVKSRRGKDEVSITHNEWLKAKRFGKDYWLYIVYDVGDEPKLKTIQDPFNTFDVEEVKEIKRYIIPAKVWDKK